MHHKPTCAAILAVGLLTLADGIARADELAEKGRAIFNKNQKAVVTLQVVLKTTYSSGGSSSPNESKQEITGTVVDPSGLTVCALSACDPGEIYKRVSPESSRGKIDFEVSDIKILMEDNSELASEIVLRDKDLDLAFIRPKVKPASPLAAVDLSKSAPAQVLDQLILLNRLNRASSRAYATSVERVRAIVQKPRTFYIADSDMNTTTLGSPVFLPSGDVVGIFVMRAITSAGQGNMRDNLVSIILPAADILKAAKQAPEGKGDSEKKEEPKSEAPKAETPAAPAGAK